MKTLSFRFDVGSDHHSKIGLLRLITLAEEKAARFSFFASPRSLRPVSFLNRRGLLTELQLAVRMGHEVGPNGGLMSSTKGWEQAASLWGRAEIAEQVEGAVKQFREAGLKPLGFASPGGVTPLLLPEILSDFGFKYLAGCFVNESEIESESYFAAKIPNVRALKLPNGTGAANKLFRERLTSLLDRHSSLVLSGDCAAVGSSTREETLQLISSVIDVATAGKVSVVPLVDLRMETSTQV